MAERETPPQKGGRKKPHSGKSVQKSERPGNTIPSGEKQKNKMAPKRNAQRKPREPTTERKKWGSNQEERSTKRLGSRRLKNVGV